MECSHWSNTLDSEGQTCLDSMDCLVWARPRPCVSYFFCDSDRHRDLWAYHSSSSWSWASERMFSAQLALCKAGSRGAQTNRSPHHLRSLSPALTALPLLSPIFCTISTQRPQVPHQANLLSCACSSFSARMLHGVVFAVAWTFRFVVLFETVHWICIPNLERMFCCQLEAKKLSKCTANSFKRNVLQNWSFVKKHSWGIWKSGMSGRFETSSAVRSSFSSA